MIKNPETVLQNLCNFAKERTDKMMSIGVSTDYYEDGLLKLTFECIAYRGAKDLLITKKQVDMIYDKTICADIRDLYKLSKMQAHIIIEVLGETDISKERIVVYVNDVDPRHEIHKLIRG